MFFRRLHRFAFCAAVRRSRRKLHLACVCAALAAVWPLGIAPLVSPANESRALLFRATLEARSERELYQDLATRSRELLARGRISQSIPYLRRMLELQPYNENAMYRLSLALIYQEEPVPREEYLRDLREAARLLEEGIVMQARVEERSEALGLRHYHRGVALWYAGEARQALAAFERSYRADFLRLDALYNQYAILEELGKEAEAREIQARYRRLSTRQGIDD